MKKSVKATVIASLATVALLFSACATNKSPASEAAAASASETESGKESTAGEETASSENNESIKVKRQIERKSEKENSSEGGGKAGSKVSESTSAAKKVTETAAQRKARKEAEKLAKKQRKDPYTGWVYIPEKNFSITNGDVKLSLRGDTGSFGIYVIPEAGSPVPVISTYDSFCSTFFSLKIGRKEYRLNREKGVKTEARRTPYGGQMAYTIDNQAQIVVDFSFLPSIATSSKVDMLRVTVYTINLGKKTENFTVKAVFDTLLGENAYTHFSTAAHSRIDAERQYMDLTSEKWVRSYNESAAIQFLLNGKGITDPYCITMANKDLLSQANWIPAVQEERSFSSVLSYNNSALGINWNPAYLDPLKSDIISFYISLAADGNEPAGKEFLQALADGRTALSANAPSGVVTTTVAPAPESVSEEELSTPYHEGMPLIASEEDDSVSDYNDESSKPEDNEKSMMEKAFDSQYINDLLKRIDELEKNPELADQEEIERLNNELDAILSLLRSLR